MLHILLWSTALVVYLTKYQVPDLLFRLTREDGPVEYGTVVCLLGLAIFLVYQSRKVPKNAPKWVMPGCLSLAGLSLLAVGEEVSWGQRLLGFQTSQTFQEWNYQKEANLHNLVPPELFNGLIIFTFLFLFGLIPLCWRELRDNIPWWVPSREISVLTLGVVLINHYRVSSVVEKGGLVLLFIVLLCVTLTSVARRDTKILATCGTCWLVGGVLFWCRDILQAANLQYEIREMLVILVVLWHSSDALARLETQD